MKFYGHANLQKNQLQNPSLESVPSFPVNPAVGQIAFINRVVYICVQNDPPPPVWIPLTNEITAYTHTQEVPSLQWSVIHNLNTTSVNVQIFNGSSEVIIPDAVIVTGPNSATVSFSSLQAGRAVVVTGHFDGLIKPTYAYTFYQSEAQTTWTINHNLGYLPIVRVFIGNEEVQPDSISHPNTSTTVIVFTTPQVGYAKLL